MVAYGPCAEAGKPLFLPQSNIWPGYYCYSIFKYFIQFTGYFLIQIQNTIIEMYTNKSIWIFEKLLDNVRLFDYSKMYTNREFFTLWSFIWNSFGQIIFRELSYRVKKCVIIIYLRNIQIFSNLYRIFESFQYSTKIKRRNIFIFVFDHKLTYWKYLYSSKFRFIRVS